ncbi:MAG: type II toxin-antitoxin system RelE/ParE family toxin [Xanthobacteraceae bacterium]
MRVEYSRRAVADLRKISDDSRRAFGDRVAEALEARIRAVIDRISREPLSAPKVEQRPGMYVASLARYPFRIFYRVLDDGGRIVHMRHAVRRPWRGAV